MQRQTYLECSMVLFLAILLAFLPGCGSRSTSDDDTVVIEDNDTIIYGERPPTQAKPEPDYIPPQPPDFGPKYVSCYDWDNGRPLWGPKPAMKVQVNGYYTYIKLYPSGEWIKICAKCYGL